MPWPHHGVEPAQRGWSPYYVPRAAIAFLSSSPTSSRRSASAGSATALIAAIRNAIGRTQGRSDHKRVSERNSTVKGKSAGADVGELGEELSDLACLLRTGEVEEAVHLVVGDVGEQSLSGSARVEGPTGVGAGGEG